MIELSPEQLQFRQAMANLAAAVHVVTTAGPRGRLGITVSAACSVTDDPPTLLVCINRSSAAHDVFVGNGRLALNVLAGEQEQLARHFSGQTKVPMEERFSWDIWEDLVGIPTIRDARVALSGRISSTLEQGTHTVFFVRVEGIRVRADARALVYDSRSFHTVGTGA
ncbi:flavin reductase [Leucobacter tenebrionis]|uniref:flavin reductase n=1 Tax=Leucobacter tenebrionis TaxID=2873270 RepID=UPI001CA6A2F9|nr:flavin reductase [Leucobacter tenebrionis]QZY51671.1 flavin reductase [Leucobacter tenebrionis]